MCVLSEEEQGRDLVSQTPGRFGAQQVHCGRWRRRKADGAAGLSPARGDHSQRPRLLFRNQLPPPRSPGRARLTPGECQPSLLPVSPVSCSPPLSSRKQGGFQVGAGAPGLEKLASRKAVSSPLKTVDIPSPQPLTAIKPGKQAAPLTWSGEKAAKDRRGGRGSGVGGNDSPLPTERAPGLKQAPFF